MFIYFQLYRHHIPELAAAKQNEAVLREVLTECRACTGARSALTRGRWAGRCGVRQMLKLYKDATVGSIARELVSNQPPRQPHRTASGTDDSGAMMVPLVLNAPYQEPRWLSRGPGLYE